MENTNGFSGKVGPAVAIALLESLKEIDTPEDTEGLGEIDLPLNLHRRLGLSGVVDKQIRRYSELNGRRDGVEAPEVARLFVLIGRRPDAATVFESAGHRLADRVIGRNGPGVGTRILPRALREKLALRSARRIARQVNPQSRIHTEGKPAALVVEHCLPAHAVADSSGCSLLGGALVRILGRYNAADYDVIHDQCEGRSDGHCRWKLEPVSP